MFNDDESRFRAAATCPIGTGQTADPLDTDRFDQVRTPGVAHNVVEDGDRVRSPSPVTRALRTPCILRAPSNTCDEHEDGGRTQDASRNRKRSFPNSPDPVMRRPSRDPASEPSYATGSEEQVPSICRTTISSSAPGGTSPRGLAREDGESPPIRTRADRIHTICFTGPCSRPEVMWSGF